MRNWECSRDISECIISHNTWQAYKNIWKRNFIRFLSSSRNQTSFLFYKKKLSSLRTAIKCAIEYSDRSFYCRTGLYTLQIGADLVELLAHLYNLFIIFFKYYVMHGKDITLWINRYVEPRLRSISSPFLSLLNMGAVVYFVQNIFQEIFQSYKSKWTRLF